MRSGFPVFLLAAILAALPVCAQTWTAQTSGTSGQLYSVSFVNDSAGWAVGDGGLIVRTTNGGTAWTAQSGLCPGSVLGVCFANERCGWAAADFGVILRTTDGGANWATQTVTNLGSLWALAFVDSLHGWAVGDAGAIEHTTNGGQTWTDQSINTMMLLGVAATDTNHAWATGGYGVVYTTTNGGANWVRQDSGRAGIWSTLAFASGSSTAWAVGTPAKIMKTTDAGTTWTLQTSGLTNNWLHSVAALDNENAWVVGASGVVLHTTDGTQWSHTTPTTQNLNGVSFPDAANGWAVGGSGTILHYSAPVNHPPAAALRLLPADSDTIAVGATIGDSVLFQWSESHDPDGDPVTYVLHVDSVLIDPAGIVTADTSVWVHFPLLTILLDDYCPVTWRVVATDGHDTTNAGNGSGYFVLDEVWGGNAVRPATATVTRFALGAFPNPFNPSTTLRVSLSRATQVRLDVYDMLGRKTATLLNGITTAGEHEVMWNCPSCAAGTYFVRMRAGGQILSQKMLLLK